MLSPPSRTAAQPARCLTDGEYPAEGGVHAGAGTHGVPVQRLEPGPVVLVLSFGRPVLTTGSRAGSWGLNLDLTFLPHARARSLVTRAHVRTEADR